MSKQAKKARNSQDNKNLQLNSKKHGQDTNSSKNKNNPFNIFLQKKFYCKELTVILDLDNTLIAALLLPADPSKCDFLFALQNGKQKTKIGVIKRPFIDSFLLALSSFATLYLFTTSEKDYTSEILTQIDPNGKFFSKIFTREFCTQDGCKKYRKDFSICGADMSRTLIVDDLPENLKDFPKNGICASPFNGDPNDHDLIRVFEEIIRLSVLDDVRDGFAA